MSALGTHEITAGIGIGLEPPLSPPVVLSSSASLSQPDGLSELQLPTPPPAIRPPESAMPTQPAMAAPEPEQSPSEPLMPIQPPVQAEPVQLEPLQAEQPPAASPEPALPAMAPEPEQVEAAPVHDYFAATASADAVPEAEPVEQTPAEPVRLPEIEEIPLVASPSPEQPAVELTALVASAATNPLAEPEPASFPEIPVAEVAPKPQPVEPEPAQPTPAFDLSTPELDLSPAEPEPTPSFADAFARTRGQFRVVVRLKDADGVEVGEFRDFGTAMEGAQEVIEQVSNATDRSWPFYAGRFIRPELIVSVDVVEAERD